LSVGGLLPAAFANTPNVSGRLGRSLPFFMTRGSTSSTKEPHAELLSAGGVSACFFTFTEVSVAGGLQPDTPS